MRSTPPNQNTALPVTLVLIGLLLPHLFCFPFLLSSYTFTIPYHHSTGLSTSLALLLSIAISLAKLFSNMSPSIQVTMSSQHMDMLPPPKSSVRCQFVDASSQSSQRMSHRQKQVIDGDVVRVHETSRWRPQSNSSLVVSEQHDVPKAFNASRERELQQAIELPSSVLIAQSFRQLLNSDEPLYDVVRKDQKSYLQREYLKDIGMLEPEHVAGSRKELMFPPSPPMTPKPARSSSISTGQAGKQQICECCKTHGTR